MSNIIHGLGDNTSKDVKPDFDSGKGEYWMRQTVALRKAIANKEEVSPFPYKRRKGLAEESFFRQVDKRINRSLHTVSVKFDSEGRLIKE